MATMMKSGVPIVGALEIIGSGQRIRACAQWSDRLGQISKGASLYEAVSKHPVQFDELYRNLVKAGEGAGYWKLCSTPSPLTKKTLKP